MSTKTKKDLVQEIASTHSLHPQEVRSVVQTFLEKMIESLSTGQRLEFRHFGVFEVVSRKAKVGRNPKKADVAIAIPPRKAVKFTPGKKMKEMIEKLQAASNEDSDSSSSKAISHSESS